MLSTMEHLWKDTCSTTFSPFRRARGSDCQCWPRTSEQNEQTTLVFTVPTPATWHRGPGSFSPPRLEGFANYLRMSCSVIMSVQTMRNDEVHTNKYVCSMYLSTPCSRSEIAISHALHPIFRCTMVIRGTPALAYGTFTVNPGLLPQIPFSSRTSTAFCPPRRVLPCTKVPPSKQHKSGDEPVGRASFVETAKSNDPPVSVDLPHLVSLSLIFRTFIALLQIIFCCIHINMYCASQLTICKYPILIEQIERTG
jgi:hypothetical protein